MVVNNGYHWFTHSAHEGDRAIVISVSCYALFEKLCDECGRPYKGCNTMFKANSKKL
jgi:hypothetical protein